MAIDETELAEKNRAARQALLQDIPWHQDIWKSLTLRYQGAGLPHASLLLGNEGAGKRLLAFRLAKFLLCKSKDKKTHDAASYCDQCHSCALMDAGSHPDYLMCDQEAKGKQIKVDSIRALNEFLAKTPQISACQVVQIYPVEAMNLNAANALLKTLEEPSGESYLLLLADRLGSVLPTIRSRTQKINVHLPTTEHAVNWLAQKIPSASHDDLTQALHQCSGGPLKAERWLREGLLEQNASYIALMQAWLSGQQPLQHTSKELAKYELLETVNWWIRISLDIMKLGMGAQEQHLMHPHQAQWLGSLAATVSRLKLLTLQNKLQEIAGRLSTGQGNYNPSLLIESLLLDWQQSFNH